MWRATSCLSFFLLLLFCFVLFCFVLFFCFFCIGPVIAVPMQRLRGGVSPLSGRETLRDVGCHASSLFGHVRYTCGVTQVSGVESVPLVALVTRVNLGETWVGDGGQRGGA